MIYFPSALIRTDVTDVDGIQTFSFPVVHSLNSKLIDFTTHCYNTSDQNSSLPDFLLAFSPCSCQASLLCHLGILDIVVVSVESSCDSSIRK